MTLKIKIKKIILMKLYFRQFYITRKFELQDLFVNEGSGPGSVFFPDPDLDPGDPKTEGLFVD